MTTAISAFMVVIISIVVKAYALPIAEFLVSAWSKMFALVSPEEGARYGKEVSSYIYEEKSVSLMKGYTPSETGIRMLGRWVKGICGDLAWCIPFIPMIIAEKAAKGSSFLKNYRIPNVILAAIVTLGMMNWGFLTSENERTVLEWLSANAMIILFTLVMSKQQYLWARRFLHAWIGIAIIGAIGVLGWMTITFGLYREPIFWNLILAGTGMWLAYLGADKPVRNRMFKGHWWAVGIYWVLLTITSLTLARFLFGDVTILVTLWGTMVLLGIMLILFYGLLALLTLAVCNGGVRAGAMGLQWIAAGIRRLD